MWGEIPNLSASLPLMIAALEDACRAVAIAPSYRKAWARTHWVAIDIAPALQAPRTALFASQLAILSGRALKLAANECSTLACDLTKHKIELVKAIMQSRVNSASDIRVQEHIAVRSGQQQNQIPTHSLAVQSIFTTQAEGFVDRRLVVTKAHKPGEVGQLRFGPARVRIAPRACMRACMSCSRVVTDPDRFCFATTTRA